MNETFSGSGYSGHIPGEKYRFGTNQSQEGGGSLPLGGEGATNVNGVANHRQNGHGHQNGHAAHQVFVRPDSFVLTFVSDTS